MPAERCVSVSKVSLLSLNLLGSPLSWCFNGELRPNPISGGDCIGLLCSSLSNWSLKRPSSLLLFFDFDVIRFFNFSLFSNEPIGGRPSLLLVTIESIGCSFLISPSFTSRCGKSVGLSWLELRLSEVLVRLEFFSFKLLVTWPNFPKLFLFLVVFGDVLSTASLPFLRILKVYVFPFFSSLMLFTKSPTRFASSVFLRTRSLAFSISTKCLSRFFLALTIIYKHVSSELRNRDSNYLI